MVANRVHGGGGDYSKWSVPFIPLAPRPLSTPISSLPSSSFRRLFMKATFFLIESEKKGVGGGGNGRTM